MKSLSFDAELTPLGVEIKAQGKLKGFEADVLERHEREGHERIPGSEFSIEATIPWPLLIIRGFKFAQEKASRFIDEEKAALI